MVDDTSQDILNKIVLNLSHYKNETIMVLGDSKDPFCRFLEIMDLNSMLKIIHSS